MLHHTPSHWHHNLTTCSRQTTRHLSMYRQNEHKLQVQTNLHQHVPVIVHSSCKPKQQCLIQLCYSLFGRKCNRKHLKLNFSEKKLQYQRNLLSGETLFLEYENNFAQEMNVEALFCSLYGLVISVCANHYLCSYFLSEPDQLPSANGKECMWSVGAWQTIHG